MKIKSVTINRRKKSFEVTTYTQVYSFPFAQADPQPSSGDGIIEATIDPELGREGFSYRLTSGREGVVLMDHVLEYN
ncbi:MAG: hypothetical protein HYZ00_00745, partial [Candidatus Hydrogenedentes bacterium]|nr:hypothetical protein [Candidatus Hydrogenedentota bacterium]